MKAKTINTLLIVSFVLLMFVIAGAIIANHMRTDWVKTAKQYRTYEEEKSQMSLLPEEVGKRFTKLLK